MMQVRRTAAFDAELKLLFAVYDIRNDGVIHRGEFAQVQAAVADQINCFLEQDQVQEAAHAAIPSSKTRRVPYSALLVRCKTFENLNLTVFDMIDDNGDQVINFDEFKGWMLDMLSASKKSMATKKRRLAVIAQEMRRHLASRPAGDQNVRRRSIAIAAVAHDPAILDGVVSTPMNFLNKPHGAQKGRIEFIGDEDSKPRSLLAVASEEVGACASFVGIELPSAVKARGDQYKDRPFEEVLQQAVAFGFLDDAAAAIKLHYKAREDLIERVAVHEKISVWSAAADALRDKHTKLQEEMKPLAAEVQQLKQIEKDRMHEALSLLAEASERLQLLEPSHMSELVEVEAPPIQVTRVMEAVCIFLGLEVEKTDCWQTAKRHLGKETWPATLKRLLGYDKDNIEGTTMQQIEHLITDASFGVGAKDATRALACWVRAVHVYNCTAQQALADRELLWQADEKFRNTVQETKQTREELVKVQHELEALNAIEGLYSK